MHFNIAEWRRFYDKIHGLDKTLKNSYWTIDEEKVKHPPLIELSEEAQKAIEKEIEDLIKLSGSYLNICDMPSAPVLWKYNVEDPSTWVSHESFKYQHLV
jgi:hypothetical protein